MIVDERTYTLATGKLGELLNLYRQGGYAAQRRHLGEPLGIFSVEVGELDGWVHMWQYQNVEDRAQRRERLARDPQWQAFTRASAGLILHRRNRLLEGVELG